MTPEQQKHVDKHWEDGKAPKTCIGKCVIGGVFECSCLACGWCAEDLGNLS